MISHKQPSAGSTSSGGNVTVQDVLNAYNELASTASIYQSSPLALKLQTAPSPVGDNDYRMVAMTQGDQGGVTRGAGFVIDPTSKYIVATRDMFAIDVTFYCTAQWGEGDSLCVGVGIGNHTQLPQYAGQDVVGKAYVSRFHDEKVGKANRQNTMKVSQRPVGRNTFNGLGVKQGDKIFPVMWRTDGSQGTIQIYDLIMSVTEIPQSV